MNCSKCGLNTSCKIVGISETFHICHSCNKIYRNMTENLRLEYVEKLKETENYFFNSGKEEPPRTVFIDDEEMFEQKPVELTPTLELEETPTLPQEIFG